MARPGGAPTFALHVGLGPIPASVDDVLHEFGDRLDAFEPRLSQPTADFELSLTIVAGDLWVAILAAMSAVTGTGYPVLQLDARAVPQRATVGRPGPDDGA